jgi:YegS/Rv2252/BmrU family lipid kinase
MKLIINPNSGKLKQRGKLDALVKNIKRIIKKSYIEITKSPLHATEIAYKAAKNGVKTIISVGGDGTLNEIITGIRGYNVNLGIIPTGSGNDFARSLNLHKNPLLILKNLCNYRPKKIDLISVNGNSVGINVIGTGIDSEVVRVLKGSKKYFAGFYKALKDHQPYNYDISIDGKKKIFENVNLIAIANGKYFGHKMFIAPEARLDDGYFDIIIVEGLSRFKLFCLFPEIYLGLHIHNKNVHTFKAKELEINKPDGLYYEKDGDLAFSDSLKLKILDREITVLTRE